jgi:exosortase/archaeosortase family protein
MRIVIISLIPLALFAVSPVFATTDAPPIALGSFLFDGRLFGDTMTPAVPPDPGPLLGAGAWLNVVPERPAPGTYLTGPNFNTGIFMGLTNGYVITYNTPIINGPGPDLGIITSPNPNPGEPIGNFLGVPGFGGGLFDPLKVGVDTGVTKSYYAQNPFAPDALPGPPRTGSLFVTPVDLSDFGVAEGEGIQSIGLNASNGGAKGGPLLATFRVAGFERGDAVAVPEPALLRRLLAKHLYGRELNAAVNPILQRLTAWGAAKMLGARSDGVYIALPTVVLEVQEWCSGLYAMKWLLLLAVVIALLSPAPVPWKLALVLAAPLIAFEANVLRVAAIAWGLETFGHVPKDWLGWGAVGFGAGQVLGLGWVAARSATVKPIFGGVKRSIASPV